MSEFFSPCPIQQPANADNAPRADMRFVQDETKRALHGWFLTPIKDAPTRIQSLAQEHGIDHNETIAVLFAYNGIILALEGKNEAFKRMCTLVLPESTERVMSPELAALMKGFIELKRADSAPVIDITNAETVEED